MWTDYEHYTSSPRNPIPHLSDFSRWPCHPRNKQKKSSGSSRVRVTVPSLQRSVSQGPGPHHPAQLFISIDSTCSERRQMLWLCNSPISSSLLCTSIIVQRRKDFVIWSVIAIIAQAGHKKDSIDADNGSQIPHRMWNITNRKCESDIFNLRTKKQTKKKLTHHLWRWWMDARTKIQVGIWCPYILN